MLPKKILLFVLSKCDQCIFKKNQIQGNAHFQQNQKPTIEIVLVFLDFRGVHLVKPFIQYPFWLHLPYEWHISMIFFFNQN